MIASLLLTALSSPAPSVVPSQEPAYLPATQGAADPSTRPSLQQRFPDWDARDTEGRWACLEVALQASPDLMATLVSQLAEAREVELLEWLALTETEGTQPALDALFQWEDPRWMRLAAARLHISSSHGGSAAQLLMEQRSGLAKAWAEWHQDSLSAAQRRTMGALQAGSPVLDEQLQALLPPYDPRVEARVLAEAEHAVPFAGLRAEPGVLYQHQVRRAIQRGSLQTTPHPDFLKALGEVAVASLPELSGFAARACSELHQRHVPWRTLLAGAEDSTRSPEDREALLFGASYGPTEQLWLVLHRYLEQPQSPLWRVALERLAEVGDAFTLERLERLAEGLAREQRSPALRAATAIAKRVTEPDSTMPDNLMALREDLAQALVRTAYGRQAGEPLAEEYLDWATRHYRPLRRGDGYDEWLASLPGAEEHHGYWPAGGQLAIDMAALVAEFQSRP